MLGCGITAVDAQRLLAVTVYIAPDMGLVFVAAPLFLVHRHIHYISWHLRRIRTHLNITVYLPILDTSHKL